MQIESDLPTKVDCYQCKTETDSTSGFFPFCCSDCKEAYMLNRPVSVVHRKHTIAEIQAKLGEWAAIAREKRGIQLKKFGGDNLDHTYEVAQLIFGS
jgi:hypothetical protein